MMMLMMTSDKREANILFLNTHLRTLHHLNCWSGEDVVHNNEISRESVQGDDVRGIDEIPNRCVIVLPVVGVLNDLVTSDAY